MPKDIFPIKPYAHDCNHCVWVSWIHIKDGGKHGSDWGNMYLHTCPATQRQSVIIRFSDEASDYWSSPVGVCCPGSLG